MKRNVSLLLFVVVALAALGDVQGKQKSLLRNFFTFDLAFSKKKAAENIFKVCLEKMVTAIILGIETL